MFSNNKCTLKYKRQKLSHPCPTKKPYKNRVSVQPKPKPKPEPNSNLQSGSYLINSSFCIMDVTELVVDYAQTRLNLNYESGTMFNHLEDEIGAMDKLDRRITSFIKKCRQYQQVVTLIFFCRKYHHLLKNVDKYVLIHVLLPYTREFNFRAAYQTLHQDFILHITLPYAVRPAIWQECYLTNEVKPYRTLLDL